jgi:antirestriction protein ArdC
VKKDLYVEVSNRIAAQLESGVAPWVKPWSVTAGRNIPHNAITGRPYSGVNVLMLWMAMNNPAYTVPAWATFNQIKNAGGRLKPDSKGTGIEIYFVKPMESKTRLGTDGKPAKFMMLKSFHVFNVGQCEGLPEKFTGVSVEPRDESRRDATIEEFLTATGAKFYHGGDRAFYSPAHDAITLPAFEAFKSASDYYGTAAHELAHWTGHKARLDRQFGARFVYAQYAAEELVAELCSAFIAAEFGIDGQLQNAEYIAVWIRLLKDDSKAFFTAASKAQAAADYLRGKALAESTPDAAAA